jgi:hypothetical protein
VLPMPHLTCYSPTDGFSKREGKSSPSWTCPFRPKWWRGKKIWVYSTGFTCWSSSGKLCGTSRSF